MNRSRIAECSDPTCGTLEYNGTGHEAYPHHGGPTACVQCPIENCNWVGETSLCVEHHLKKHPPFKAEHVPLSDATCFMVMKEDLEKHLDDVGKLKHEVDQSKMLEYRKEKEWREAKEAREKCENDLLKRIDLQSMDPIRIQTSILPQIEANSTASLGRAEQPPPQERSRTLDAEGPDFQQFLDVYEQEGNDDEENYQQPQCQSEQRNQAKEALVVVPMNNKSPPPLPPKPKQDPQNEFSNADLMPPKLPPKPNSHQGPANAQWSDTVPPPRPPKPASAAVPLQPRRQRRSPPPLPQDRENREERREVSPSSAVCIDKNSVNSVNCGANECTSIPADCPGCVQLREKNYQLKNLLKRSIFSINTKPKASRPHSK